MVSSANYNLTITAGIQSQINATNPVKFNGQKEQSEKEAAVENAKIKFRKIKQSDKYSVQGVWSDDYVIDVECDTAQEAKNMTELMSRYRLITFKVPAKRRYTYLKDCYKLESIVSPQRYKGAGTKAVQALLERSLADKETAGRIVVYAEITDGQTSPAGFFYKLGFRFIDKEMNEIMDEWIKKRIKTNSPKLTGMMYLPREHINKLMMYNMKYM